MFCDAMCGFCNTHPLEQECGILSERSSVLRFSCLLFLAFLWTLKDTKCVEVRALSVGVTAWQYGIARKASTPMAQITLLSCEDSQHGKGIVVCLVTQGPRFDPLSYCCQHRKELVAQVVRSMCPCRESRSLISPSLTIACNNKNKIPERKWRNYLNSNTNYCKHILFTNWRGSKICMCIYIF